MGTSNTNGHDRSNTNLEGNVPPAGGFSSEDQAKAAQHNTRKEGVKKTNPTTSDEANNYMYQDQSEKPDKQNASSMDRSSRYGNGNQSIDRRDTSDWSMQRPNTYTDPFDLFDQFAQQMDDVFEAFGFGSGRRSRRERYNQGAYGNRTNTPLTRRASDPSLDGLYGMSSMSWRPQIETYKEGDTLVVSADLPGIEKDDVHCEITRDNQLVIRGERKQHSASGDKDSGWRTERSYGSFQRTLSLPHGVKEDAIKASFKNGVLEIRIDMDNESNKNKKIDIM